MRHCINGRKPAGSNTPLWGTQKLLRGKKELWAWAEITKAAKDYATACLHERPHTAVSKPRGILYVDWIEHYCKIQIQSLKRKQIQHTNKTKKQFHIKDSTQPFSKATLYPDWIEHYCKIQIQRLEKKTNTACKLLHSSFIKDCTLPLGRSVR